MIHPLWLALPLAATLPQAPPAEAPSILRTLDVRTSVPVTMEGCDAQVVLLPLSRDYRAEYDHSSSAIGRDPSAVANFLRELDPAQWEYEGRSMDMHEHDRLVVEAPQALQDVVTRALAVLEDTVARPVTLVVDIVSFGPNPGVSNLPPMIPASEVSRWTSVGNGHESYELSARPGELCVQRAERTIHFVLQPEPEVAERAAIFALSPEQFAVGTAIHLAVAPGRNGSWLAFALRNGRYLDSDSLRDESNSAMISNDQGVTKQELLTSRSDPRVANHSLAVNAFLPDGKALVFVGSAGLESRVVFVRQVGATPPPVANLPEDLKRVVSRSATALVRTDAFNVPLVRAHGTEFETRLPSLARRGDSELDQPMVLASIDNSATTDAASLLSSMDAEYDVIQLGPTYALVGSNREPIERALARAAQISPEPQSIVVTLSLKRGGRDGSALCRAVVPMRLGARSTIVLGRESAADLAMQVQIAQSSSIQAPEVRRLFDGLTVTVAPAATRSGGLALEFDAHARWSRTQPREFTSGGALTVRLQLPDADVFDAERTVVFPKSDGSPRKVTLGNAGASNEALTLDVEIADLR